MHLRQRLLGYLARTAQRTRTDDKGFTLIELAIVIAVIAILIAVALPTFLGVQSSAHNSAAEQNLINSVTSAKTFYADNQSSYAGLDAGTPLAMQGLEPEMTYTAAGGVPIGTANGVDITVAADGQAVGFAAYTGGSNSICILAINVAGTGSSDVSVAGPITVPGTWWSTAAPSDGVCTAVSAPGTATWSQNTP
jgi:type IV pilus assembly protein PilA